MCSDILKKRETDTEAYYSGLTQNVKIKWGIIYSPPYSHSLFNSICLLNEFLNGFEIILEANEHNVIVGG